MPNYNIVVNTSNFKPFSFQDKIAPLILYNQSYDQLNEKLEKYAEDYGSIPETNNAEIDGVVNDYNNRLRELSDRFANGMTNSVGNDLRKMFIEGKQKLTPIKQAISDYNDYVDKVEKLGPDAIFKKQYEIGDFYNKQRSPLEYKSASEIQKQAKNYFEGIQNLYAQAPEIIGSLGNGYDLIQKGVSLNREDIMNIIAEGMNSPSISDIKVSEGIVEGLDYLYHNLGIDEYDESAKQKVQDNLILGLMQAVKAPEFSTQRKEKPQKRELTPKEQLNLEIAETLYLNDGTDRFSDDGSIQLTEEDIKKYNEIKRSQSKPVNNNNNSSQEQQQRQQLEQKVIGKINNTEDLYRELINNKITAIDNIEQNVYNTNYNGIFIGKDSNNKIVVYEENSSTHEWKKTELTYDQRDAISKFLNTSDVNQLSRQMQRNPTVKRITERIRNYVTYGESIPAAGGGKSPDDVDPEIG